MSEATVEWMSKNNEVFNARGLIAEASSDKCARQIVREHNTRKGLLEALEDVTTGSNHAEGCEYYELGREHDCDCNLSKYKALIVEAEGE